MWLRCLVDRFGTDIRIVLHGISTGAAAIIQCAYGILAEDTDFNKEKNSVKLVVADSSFFRFSESVRHLLFLCMPKAGVCVEDCGDRLIVPGFNDLHVHAPQFPNRGLGMDKELLPWLNTYTFPEEAKFKDEGYAERVYGRFVRELWRVGTTRAAIFATIHASSARVLADLMETAGLSSVGERPAPRGGTTRRDERKITTT